MLIYTKINHFLLFFLLFFIIRDYLEIITMSSSRCTIKIVDVNNKVSVIKGEEFTTDTGRRYIAAADGSFYLITAFDRNGIPLHLHNMGTQADITQRMSRSSNKKSQKLTGEYLIQQTKDYFGEVDEKKATEILFSFCNTISHYNANGEPVYRCQEDINKILNGKNDDAINYYAHKDVYNHITMRKQQTRNTRNARRISNQVTSDPWQQYVGPRRYNEQYEPDQGSSEQLLQYNEQPGVNPGSILREKESNKRRRQDDSSIDIFMKNALENQQLEFDERIKAEKKLFEQALENQDTEHAARLKAIIEQVEAAKKQQGINEPNDKRFTTPLNQEKIQAEREIKEAKEREKKAIAQAKPSGFNAEGIRLGFGPELGDDIEKNPNRKVLIIEEIKKSLKKTLKPPPARPPPDPEDEVRQKANERLKRQALNALTDNERVVGVQESNMRPGPKPQKDWFVMEDPRGGSKVGYNTKTYGRKIINKSKLLFIDLLNDPNSKYVIYMNTLYLRINNDLLSVNKLYQFINSKDVVKSKDVKVKKEVKSKDVKVKKEVKSKK